MSDKNQEITDWLTRVKQESAFEYQQPRIGLKDIQAFHANRNEPFTWDAAWGYVVYRVAACRRLHVRRFVDAQFTALKTGEDFLELGLLFNNPDVIQQAMQEEAFLTHLRRYFDGVSFTITNFEDQTRVADSVYKYHMAIRLTFK